MKKIKEYQLVSDSQIEWLNKRVNNLIARGYQPLGNPQTTITYENERLIVFYSQVMVKYEEDSE